MHLKGEGAEANHTKAVELYEMAAEEGHVRALNGLGYEYFHGHALPRNFVSNVTRVLCVAQAFIIDGSYGLEMQEGFGRDSEIDAPRPCTMYQTHSHPPKIVSMMPPPCLARIAPN